MGSGQPLIVDMCAEQRWTNRPAMTRIFTACRDFTGASRELAAIPRPPRRMLGVPYEVSTVAEVIKGYRRTGRAELSKCEMGLMAEAPRSAANHHHGCQELGWALCRRGNGRI